jgi:CheY-like chemotaxis protein
VYLPAYGTDPGGVSARLAEADAGFHGNGETILVVDDEASVRNILRDVLTKWNFNVLTAADGAAALVHMTEKREVLRTIITDLHMPNMDGLAFARVIKGWSPNVRIIVISGLLENRDMNEFENLGISTLLNKPFSQKELANALKAAFQG